MEKLVSSKRAAQGVNVEVLVNEAVVDSIANKLAISMVMSNDSVPQIMSVEAAKECFNYALRVVLRQNSGAKPSYEQIPSFLCDITIPLRSVYRGVRINVSEIEGTERPNSYETFLDVLASIGVPTGKILKVAPEGTSNVMKCGVVDVAGAETLVGVESESTIEELVLRSMLNVAREQQDKLDRVLGHMDCMYVSRDELLRQWACSLPVGSRV